MEPTPTDSTGHSVEGVPSGTSDRRDFMKKAAIGGAAAWATPMLLSSTAGAQFGTQPCNPLLINNNQQESFDITDGSMNSVTNNAPTANAQVAVALAPLDDITAAANVEVLGAGWSPLIIKEVSSASGDRLALWAWIRQGANVGSPVSFQLDGAVAGPWRGLVAGFSNVSLAGTAVAQGQASSTTIPAPSVTIPGGTAGLVMWVGATLPSPTGTNFGVPSGGYSTGAGDFVISPHILAGYLSNVPAGTLAANTVTTGYTSSVMGAQIPLLCTI